jgi:hypothetical protein
MSDFERLLVPGCASLKPLMLPFSRPIATRGCGCGMYVPLSFQFLVEHPIYGVMTLKKEECGGWCRSLRR